MHQNTTECDLRWLLHQQDESVPSACCFTLADTTIALITNHRWLLYKAVQVCMTPWWVWIALTSTLTYKEEKG